MAMKIKYTLDRNGVGAEVVRLPAELMGKGCSFGVEISCKDESRALKIITVNDLSFGKFVRTESRIPR